MKHQMGIVFIHGAGLGSFIWEELRSYLNSPILAIDYPNREADKKANLSLTFDDYLQSAIRQIEEWEADSFVIAAHSIGGCLGLVLHEHLKDRVKGFIAIGASIPKSGNSFVSAMPFPQKLILPLILRLLGTTPPPTSIEQEMCNDLSPEKAAEIVSRFSPESRLLYTSPIKYSAVPNNSLYISLSNDKAIPPALQQNMINNLKAQKVVNLDSGHLPMISKAKELAEAMNAFLEKL